MFVSTRSLSIIDGIDGILDKKIMDEAKNFIDDKPLYEFIYDWITRRLHEFDKHELNGEKLSLLIEHEMFSDVQGTAETIISNFCSLPDKYTFTMELPAEMNAKIKFILGSINLSDNIRLVRVDNDFKSMFSIGEYDSGSMGMLGLLGLPGLATMAHNWKDNSCVLQIQTKGYTTKYGQTATIQDAIASIKSVFGLGIALRIFRRVWNYNPSLQRTRVNIHRFESKKWVLHGSEELSAELSEAISNVRIEDMGGNIDDAHISEAAMNNLNLMRELYNSPGHMQRLALAGQWLFDSYQGSNSLLSFVQATVAIEILLGSKDVSDLLGLNELLKNRCAYLIGKSQAQRDRIMKDFGEIYNVRSKIVHAGKARLSAREQEMLFKLRWMCSRVIQEEMNLIAADKPKVKAS